MATLYEFEQSLSPARRRAFIRAQRELQDQARGAKWRELSQIADKAQQAYISEHWDEIEAIRQEADLKVQAIKEQIDALYKEQTRVRDEARNAESAITIKAYDTLAYLEAQALASAEWRKDEAIYQEKLAELMERYTKAQVAN